MLLAHHPWGKGGQCVGLHGVGKGQGQGEQASKSARKHCVGLDALEQLLCVWLLKTVDHCKRRIIYVACYSQIIQDIPLSVSGLSHLLCRCDCIFMWHSCNHKATISKCSVKPKFRTVVVRLNPGLLSWQVEMCRNKAMVWKWHAWFSWMLQSFLHNTVRSCMTLCIQFLPMRLANFTQPFKGRKIYSHVIPHERQTLSLSETFYKYIRARVNSHSSAHVHAERWQAEVLYLASTAALTHAKWLHNIYCYLGI